MIPAYASPDQIPGVTDPNTRAFGGCEHIISYEPGTRRARSAEISLISKTGERLDIELEPLICFRMKGIGYTHPEWGHGRWKGELAIEAESWKCDLLDPLALENLHIQQVMRARCDGRTGVGVLEQLALGPHAPSGFKQFLDGAE